MRRPIIIAMLIVAYLMVTRVTPAHACEPSIEEPPTLADRVNGADLIVVGQIPARSLPEFAEPTDVIPIEVEAYYKGEGPIMIEVTGFGSGGGDCLNLPPDERSVFFISQSRFTYTLYYASVYDAVMTDNEENLAEIEALTGSFYIPPADEGSDVGRPMPSAAIIGAGGSFLCLTLLLGGGLLVFVLKRRQGTKNSTSG